ncbi:sigma-70 family RNA polymerase sigma factor [Companilactobacillus baiquanensis]|uniref:Sigma-70 family RNA polymerase sigma factor n=1 Tax=Companilactobacillus baiquanensis TaxID=2486005 RepID=A0ABW1UVH0_9LACO|nr:sigma-70 family RNA polymerase sigma factor [Companilactobacillus baiquanensis]
MNKTETNLILRVKNENDSNSLQKLIKRYRPMIENLFQQYYIHGYDRNDWYQEAFIVCHKTCLIFNGNNGSQFGSFFKMRFKNHIIDIVRRENTFKRQANQNANSFEVYLVENNQSFITNQNAKMVDLVNGLDDYFNDLSHREALALRYLLGKIKFSEACEKAKCTKEQMVRATSRCKTKIKDRLR